jgi:hypothetical protein
MFIQPHSLTKELYHLLLLLFIIEDLYYEFVLFRFAEPFTDLF